MYNCMWNPLLHTIWGRPKGLFIAAFIGIGIDLPPLLIGHSNFPPSSHLHFTKKIVVRCPQ